MDPLLPSHREAYAEQRSFTEPKKRKMRPLGVVSSAQVCGALSSGEGWSRPQAWKTATGDRLSDNVPQRPHNVTMDLLPGILLRDLKASILKCDREGLGFCPHLCGRTEPQLG